MAQLLNISEQKASVAISSVEIAQLCEKRHDHVMRDIRNMLAELNLNAPQFWGTYKPAKAMSTTAFSYLNEKR